MRSEGRTIDRICRNRRCNPGVGIGVTFRLKFLLGVVVLVLSITLLFAFSYGYSFLNTLLIIIVAQALLQGSYFVGLVSRVFFSHAQRKLASLSGPEADRLQRDS
jgi:hypothetical protein